MDFTKNPKKIVIVAGAAVAFLCLLFFDAFSVSVMGMSQGIGKSFISCAFENDAFTMLLSLILIAGAAAAIASAFIPEGTLPIKNNLLALIGAGAALAATLIILLMLNSTLSDGMSAMGASGFGGYKMDISIGFGVWLGILGFAASAVCAFLVMKEEQ